MIVVPSWELWGWSETWLVCRSSEETPAAFSAAITADASVEFCVRAADAVFAWVSIEKSKVARSGTAETEPLPLTVIVLAGGGVVAEWPNRGWATPAIAEARRSRPARVKDMPTAHLAGPGTVRLGEDVVAIGNALNLEGAPSITRGVVSAVGRDTATLQGVIQTDAAISSGSSGGALVDDTGAVIGITTEALVGDPSVSVEDIAFAIPADRVVAVLRGMGLEVPTTG